MYKNHNTIKERKNPKYQNKTALIKETNKTKNLKMSLSSQLGTFHGEFCPVNHFWLKNLDISFAES